MIDCEIDAKLKMELAKMIMKYAKDRSKTPATSYSRTINAALKDAFEKGVDKKVLNAAKEK